MPSDARWMRIEALFDEAVERPEGERRSWLAEACADREIRCEVEAMLTSHEQTSGLLERKPFDALDSTWTAPEAAPRADKVVRGREVGPYRLLRQIGHGGMGVVYQAHDPRLDRHVALKFLPRELGILPAFPDGDPPSLHEERLLSEARTASALDHPNICTIYDIGYDDDRPYIAMAHYDGETLAEKIERGPLPEAEAVDYALQAASGLARAHEAGVVHRDVKPANLMVTERGVVKILDFGIAKLVDATMSVSGELPGTPAYMSPERFESRKIDHRADLWSLGVVLYEMLSGRRPFDGTGPTAVILAILQQEPAPIATLVPGVSPAMARVVERLLRKALDERYASADELVADLERAASEPAAGEPAAGEPVLAQEIRTCTASDGVRLACSTTGAGPPLVKAANWFNHLEFDWESPVWRHVIRGLASDRLLVRYDARGNGLSDWDVAELSFEAFVHDLETVVDTLELQTFALLGISQGCAVSIAYAVRHPERVTHLVLHGGYASGWRHRGSAVDVERREALKTLMLHSWGEENPAFRQVFTALYVPGGEEEHLRWFNDLQRISTSPENAVRLWEVLGDIEVGDLLARVRVPTLVLHSRGDAAVPFAEGRKLAAGIAGARFVPLESANHLVLGHEAAWPVFLSEVRGFLGG